MTENRGTLYLFTAVLTALVAASTMHIVALDSWIAVVAGLSAFISLVMLHVETQPFTLEPLLRTAGYALAIISVYAFFSPTFGGARDTYLSLMNMMALAESSVVLLLHGFARRPLKGYDSILFAFYADLIRGKRRQPIDVKTVQ